MKRLALALLMGGIAMGAAHAQSMNKQTDPKQSSPGATGAMQNSTSTGVATDPNGVKEQQGRSAESSPGTVGAAPGADTKSQMPNGGGGNGNTSSSGGSGR